MGYYIPCKRPTGKVMEILEHWPDSVQIHKPESFDQIPKNKALIIVIHNTWFETAVFVFDKLLYELFAKNLNDERKKEYVLMDRETAELVSGYKEAMTRRA